MEVRAAGRLISRMGQFLKASSSNEVTVSGSLTVRKLSVSANQFLIVVSEVAERSILFIFLQLEKALSLIVLKPVGRVNEANE